MSMPPRSVVLSHETIPLASVTGEKLMFELTRGKLEMEEDGCSSIPVCI